MVVRSVLTGAVVTVPNGVYDYNKRGLGNVPPNSWGNKPIGGGKFAHRRMGAIRIGMDGKIHTGGGQYTTGLENLITRGGVFTQRGNEACTQGRWELKRKCGEEGIQRGAGDLSTSRVFTLPNIGLVRLTDRGWRLQPPVGGISIYRGRRLCPSGLVVIKREWGLYPLGSCTHRGHSTHRGICTIQGNYKPAVGNEPTWDVGSLDTGWTVSTGGGA
jgi:hypothetical protein